VTASWIVAAAGRHAARATLFSQRLPIRGAAVSVALLVIEGETFEGARIELGVQSGSLVALPAATAPEAHLARAGSHLCASRKPGWGRPWWCTQTSGGAGSSRRRRPVPSGRGQRRHGLLEELGFDGETLLPAERGERLVALARVRAGGEQDLRHALRA
jgi:hypothetical protein